MQKRILAILLTVCMVLTGLLSAPTAFAANSVMAEYTFTGDEADLPGYAEGTVTVLPNGAAAGGYYVLYFADDDGVLPGYEPIAALENTGKMVKFTFSEGALLPSGATRIAVYRSDTTQAADTALSAAVAVAPLPRNKRITLDAAEMTFASVSDVHVNYDSSGYGASRKWTAALNMFAEAGMDMVVVSGDMTGDGYASEYVSYNAAIAASDYPASQIYEATGNHDSQRFGDFLDGTANGDEVRPFEDSPYFHLLREGDAGEKDNLFIFMAQELTGISNTSNCDNFSTRQLDWLENLLITYSGTDTNIFILQHAVTRNFGPGDRYNGAYSQPMLFDEAFPGNMRFKALLHEYKEAITMSGHTHLSFYEGLNFSDENGTAARMIHNSSTSQPRSYTASGSLSYDCEGKVTDTYGSEGYMVYVYADCITYIGYNFSTGLIIPSASYIMPSYTEDRSEVVDIELTKAPDKTEYEAGEWFDAAGVEVTATLADGSKQVVRGWGISNVGGLTAEDTYVEIYYGGLAKKLQVPITVSAVDANAGFAGAGTAADPYLISTSADFKALTDLFNASTDSTAMYGEGVYFRQTADIDMTGVTGYNGTDAYGSAKKYFAGHYDGNGYRLTVDINGSGDRAVFPYVYGGLSNLIISGKVVAVDNAQPVRTLYGYMINCVFDLDVQGGLASGLMKTNYSYVYNVYTAGNLTGTTTKAGADTNSNDYTYHNLYHYRTNTATGQLVSDASGIQSNDYAAIAAAFNDTSAAEYANAAAKLTGGSMCEAVATDNGIVFSHTSTAAPGAGADYGFAGLGTAADPYLIQTNADFAKLTELFNAGSDASVKFGEGMYFRQTADIDMTGVAGYNGTDACSDTKRYFAGHYNGNGYRITVDIDGTGDRAVFPYVYGGISNLIISGSVVAANNAQPIRTLYGYIINCVFDLDVKGNLASGLLKSNYSYVYNVFTTGNLTGSTVKASTDTDSNAYVFHNLYHYRTNTATGQQVTSSKGLLTNDYAAIAAAFNDRTTAEYANAAAKLTGGSMCEAVATIDGIVFTHTSETVSEESLAQKLTVTPLVNGFVNQQVGENMRTLLCVKLENAVYGDRIESELAQNATLRYTLKFKAADTEVSIDLMPEEVRHNLCMVFAPFSNKALQLSPNTEYILTLEITDAEGEMLYSGIGSGFVTPDEIYSDAAYVAGDVDFSGKVDVADIMKLKALIMADKWSEEELAIGDLDESDSLDVADIMGVKSIIMSGV